MTMNLLGLGIAVTIMAVVMAIPLLWEWSVYTLSLFEYMLLWAAIIVSLLSLFTSLLYI
jgi:ABC-type long-subunit fatty acid transport system fused permease/ATPase subunit